MSDESDLKTNPEAITEARKLLADRPWPVTVKLGTPVEFGKETIEELVFQRGTFGVLKGLNIPSDRLPTIDELMQIGAKLCGRSLRAIESLDPDDASEVFAIALGFFGRCQGVGKRL